MLFLFENKTNYLKVNIKKYHTINKLFSKKPFHGFQPRVESVNRQKLLKRVKRDFAPLKQNSNQNTSETINDPHWEEMWYLVR